MRFRDEEETVELFVEDEEEVDMVFEMMEVKTRLHNIQRKFPDF